MNEEFENFDEAINKFSVDKGDNTSTFLYDYSDKIYIKKLDTKCFLKYYLKFNEGNLSEKLGDFSQISFSGSFEIDDLIEPKILVNLIQEVIADIQDIDNNNEVELFCFYFYNEKERTFKVQFPFIETKTETQKNLITPILNSIKQELNKNDDELDNNLSITADKKYRTVFGSDDLKLKYIFTHLNKIGSKENYTINLSNFLTGFTLSLNEFDLSYFLSSNYIPREGYDAKFEDTNTEVITEDIPEEKDEFEEYQDFEEPEINEYNKDIEPDTDKFKITEELINLIEKKYFEDETHFREICRSVKWAAKNDKRRGFELIKSKLLEFKITKHDNTKVHDLCYSKEKTHHNTIRTLAYYSKKENPTEYKAWYTKWVDNAIESTLSCYERNISKLLYKINWLEYIYDGEQWYQFYEGKWKNIKKKAFDLREKLSSIINLINKYKLKLIGRLSRQKGNEETARNAINDIITKCHKICDKLNGRPGRDNIISLAAEFFREEDFNDVINKNPNLTGIEGGGVIEVNNNHAIYRQCRPDDYISICTSIIFYKNFTFQSPILKNYLSWLEKMFIYPDVIMYMRRFLASLLRSGNPDKIFMSWIGDGDNAKSTFRLCIETVFGIIYSFTFPSHMITSSRRPSSSTTSELDGAKHAKVVFVSEPKRMDKVNSAFIKEITGDKNVYNRQIFKEGELMEITFKPIYLSNKPLRLDEYDDAIKRRCYFVEFLGKWSLNAPDDEEEQKEQRLYKLDNTFDQQIPNMARAMLWLMVHDYEAYRKEGLNPPDRIKNFKDNFWKETDMLINFVDECIMKTGNPEDKIKVKTTYDLFRVWYIATNGQDVPSMEFFRSEMTCKLGNTSRNTWTKYIFSEKGNEYIEKNNIE